MAQKQAKGSTFTSRATARRDRTPQHKGSGAPGVFASITRRARRCRIVRMPPQQDKRVLYVGGLSEEATEETLHAAFVPFGDVKEVNIPASRGAAVPSRHRRAASPGEDVVAGFFFDFEAVRTEYAPRRSTSRATSRARRTTRIEALPSSPSN